MDVIGHCHGDTEIVDMPRKPRLKRCPFCKQKASYWKDYDGFWYVGCVTGFCGVSPSTSGQPTLQEAADTWNDRATMRRKGAGDGH